VLHEMPMRAATWVEDLCSSEGVLGWRSYWVARRKKAQRLTVTPTHVCSKANLAAEHVYYMASCLFPQRRRAMAIGKAHHCFLHMACAISSLKATTNGTHGRIEPRDIANDDADGALSPISHPILSVRSCRLASASNEEARSRGRSR
jgi:hypothetical protein